MAIKNIIEFFKFIKREKELYRKIFAFSISYNYRIVRIYNYYFIIDKNKITFYYYLIYKFNFIALNNNKKWTAYKFIKNIYDK